MIIVSNSVEELIFKMNNYKAPDVSKIVKSFIN